MPVPDFQSRLRSVLKACAAGEVRCSDVVTSLGVRLALTELASKLSELLSSGKQTTFANRVNWAKSHLGNQAPQWLEPSGRLSGAPMATRKAA
jgi:restriction system protein